MSALDMGPTPRDALRLGTGAVTLVALEPKRSGGRGEEQPLLGGMFAGRSSVSS